MNSSKFGLTLISLALLAACGGGGGDNTPTRFSALCYDGSTQTSTVSQDAAAAQCPAAPVATSVAIVTTEPAAPTYTGEELAAYNTLNTARSTCGFGYLQQNTMIDAAASNHVSWMIKNNTVSHYETPGTGGFTGIFSENRMTAVGYDVGTLSNGFMSGGDDFSMESGGIILSKTGFGQLGTRRLLSAPYHLQSLMYGYRELGVAVKTGGQSNADVIVNSNVAYSRFVLFNLSTSKTNAMVEQIQEPTDILTYPCQGVTNTAYELRDEEPNPVPGRNLATNPVGQPIYVQARIGVNLIVTSATVTGPAGSVALLPTITKAGDLTTNPSAIWLGTGNQAIILPSAPLAPNTSYAVVINGTAEGTAFTKSFTFATGS